MKVSGALVIGGYLVVGLCLASTVGCKSTSASRSGRGDSDDSRVGFGRWVLIEPNKYAWKDDSYPQPGTGALEKCADGMCGAVKKINDTTVPEGMTRYIWEATECGKSGNDTCVCRLYIQPKTYNKMHPDIEPSHWEWVQGSEMMPGKSPRLYTADISDDFEAKLFCTH